ncbi:uncharacterized protein M421DRAFT_371562 [Didymella exigua CBS 183.55]|uniref:Uncharacterized protein n=1 Tax=Didymella exigua CBS 183.55 TaxID=1150837 RepID=A0A6A5RPI3_9PLEO|nr:uncharacterized protein M421DRAFT_371562 [Didymella exigua CBS 183.55]KAF1930331.1 hypothetical protein M421DRAFT_371562 [Didymella exigua CBS 183.55]
MGGAMPGVSIGATQGAVGQAQAQLMQSRATSEYLDPEVRLQSLSCSLLRPKSMTFGLSCLSFGSGLLLLLDPLSLLFHLSFMLLFLSYPFKSLCVFVCGEKGVLLLGQEMAVRRTWCTSTSLNIE